MYNLPPEPHITEEELRKSIHPAQGNWWHKLKFKIKQTFRKSPSTPPTKFITENGVTFRHQDCSRQPIKDTSQMTLLHDYGLYGNNRADWGMIGGAIQDRIRNEYKDEN